MYKWPLKHSVPREEKNTVVPDGVSKPVVFRKKQRPASRPRTGRPPCCTMKNVGLYGRNFNPTPLMLDFINIYLRSAYENNGVFKPPTKIFSEDLGRPLTNWYSWQKKPGFTQWFLDQRNRYHCTVGVADVHDAILKNALADSAADRKLHLERFDPAYKPKNEQSFVFVGSKPRDEVDDTDITEQSRKKIESLSKTVES